jgi:hypothetical protein
VECQRKQIVLVKTKAFDYVKGGWLSKHTKLQRRDSTLYNTFFPHAEHLRKRRFLWSYYKRDCKLGSRTRRKAFIDPRRYPLPSVLRTGNFYR